jgi:two-component system cell cycle sensor histidine kinase/response regulator CckA
MTDIADTPRTTAPRGPSSGQFLGGFDLLRAAFWVAMAIGAAGAGVAIAGGPSVGPVGAVLLIGVAMTGLVFLMWLTGLGKYVGLYPARGAAEAASLVVSRSEFALLDALDEPALVAEHGATPLAANAAYNTASQAAGVLGESARPPAMDRLFGADPIASAPMYRLANAAKRGHARREQLPAAMIGKGQTPTRYEISVAPMPGGRTLWRLRDLGPAASQEKSTGAGKELFIDEAPVGFFSAKADGTILYLNQSLRAVLGVGEQANLKLREIIKEDFARVLRRDRKGFAPARAAITLRARDGMEVPAIALTTWPGAETDGGSRTMVFFAGQDVPSEGAAAPRVGAPIDGFFENAPFGATLLDSADLAVATIAESNPTLMELTQGRAAPGVRFSDLFDASEGPIELAKKLRAASHAPVEISIAANPPRAAHVYFASAPDGRGLAYVVNVAEQREIEQRLAQTEKMREIGTLASGVAHDFNNTLTVVMLSTEFLMRRHPVGDPDFEDLHKINTHALRARELTEMLLSYARQKTFKREIQDVSALVVQVQELARRLVGDSIDFKVVHARDLPFVKIDKTQIERVLMNLVTNARDAMLGAGARSGNKLSLISGVATAAEAREAGHHSVAEGEYVTIDVVDTGPGIRPEDQHKIFHSFFSTKEPGKGTGLGLTTSFGIIKQLGGYIFFDSVVGKGTTFRIYLPAYEPTADEMEEMARRDRERVEGRVVDVATRGKILLVEDEDGVRRALARTLKEFGCEVDEAENGEDALAVMEAAPGAYDLIISDVSMPLMTGPEMLRAAGVEMLGKAKVLFLSGYAPESFAQMLEEYPVSFLSKPVSATELAGKVKEILATAA